MSTKEVFILVALMAYVLCVVWVDWNCYLPYIIFFLTTADSHRSSYASKQIHSHVGWGTLMPVGLDFGPNSNDK